MLSFLFEKLRPAVRKQAAWQYFAQCSNPANPALLCSAPIRPFSTVCMQCSNPALHSLHRCAILHIALFTVSCVIHYNYCLVIIDCCIYIVITKELVHCELRSLNWDLFFATLCTDLPNFAVHCSFVQQQQYSPKLFLRTLHGSSAMFSITDQLPRKM